MWEEKSKKLPERANYITFAFSPSDRGVGKGADPLTVGKCPPMPLPFWGCHSYISCAYCKYTTILLFHQSPTRHSDYTVTGQ